jgi:cell division transport system permease protein
LGDGELPLLIAAMTLLAGLALAGAAGAAALADHWRLGAASALTIQVPDPDGAAAQGGERLAAVLASVEATPAVAEAHALSREELSALMKPWLGSAAPVAGLKLPGVIAVQLADDAADWQGLQTRLAKIAPGTLVESNGAWIARLVRLARSLQATAILAVAIVGAIAASVVVFATRAGLGARRATIEIVHGLGASDAWIAGRFARRAALHAATGAVLGTLLALPCIGILTQLAAPFGGGATAARMEGSLQVGPPSLVAVLAALPVATAAIGYLAARGTVRRWLRAFP